MWDTVGNERVIVKGILINSLGEYRVQVFGNRSEETHYRRLDELRAHSGESVRPKLTLINGGMGNVG